MRCPLPASLMMLGLAACATPEQPPEYLMAVVSATATARVAPSGDSKKVMVLPTGTVMAIEDGWDGWYLADLDAYGDFGKGWLYHDFLTLDPPSRQDGSVWPLPAILKNDSVVRDEYGVWADQLNVLEIGTRVRVVERKIGWYRIDQPLAGWLRHDSVYIDVKAFLHPGK
ncbi:MAG: hypothetical protein OEL53_17620 [Rhodospirillales bacterium]|nr:hypothetical protein [Rhodospirillales bacterium]